VPVFDKPFGQLSLELDGGVVGGDGDAHGGSHRRMGGDSLALAPRFSTGSRCNARWIARGAYQRALDGKVPEAGVAVWEYLTSSLYVVQN
jgi:hypothetical protein